MKKFINYFYELGVLQRIKHEGWRIAGVENPESVSDHSLRAAQIGFILAELEGYSNPHEICSMLVFHDIGECRIGDIHKIANRYIKADEAQAVADQLDPLEETGQKIKQLWTQTEEKTTTAGIIAKDADLLEQAVSAKEYMSKGYYAAEEWLLTIEKYIKTEAAKKLITELKNCDPYEWYQGLKKINL